MPYDCFFWLVGAAAVVAFIMAVRASNMLDTVTGKLTVLTKRLDAQHRRLEQLEPGESQQAEPSFGPAIREAAEFDLGPLPPEAGLPPVPEAKKVTRPILPGQAKPKVRRPAAALAKASPSLPIKPSKTKSSRSLEEQLGSRIFIWIAALSLALAGAFLVKHSFEKGWITPLLRVVLGTIFGIGLILGAQPLRRSYALIATGLAAAGVADLFAVTWSAVNLYKLLEPGFGFACMAVVTALAVVLSLRHGPFVALLGLVGGFATPLLMQEAQVSTATLFTYLFVLQLGLVTLAMKRAWWFISALSLFFSMVWVSSRLFTGQVHQNPVILSFFLLSSIAVYVASALTGDRDAASEDTAGPKTKAKTMAQIRHWIAWAGMLIGLVLLGVQAQARQYTIEQWGFIWLLAVGCMVLGRLRKQYLPMAWLAFVFCLALVGMWAIEEGIGWHEDRFALVAACFASTFMLGSYICHWRTAKPEYWTSLTVVSALSYFLLAHHFLTTEPFAHFWSILAGGLALLLAFAAYPLYQQVQKLPAMAPAVLRSKQAPLGILAVGVAAFMAIALAIELDRFGLTVAWALLLPAVVWVELRLRLSMLCWVARALMVMVAVRLLLNMGVLRYQLGDLPVLNWLLYGYGVPILAFGCAAWLYRRQLSRKGSASKGQAAVVVPAWCTVLESLAIAFAVYLVAWQVYHGFHFSSLADPRYVEAPWQRPRLVEWATYGNVFLAAALLLLGLGRRWTLPAFRYGSPIVGILALSVLLLTCLLWRNPMWAHEAVGNYRLFNWLLYIYGLPAVLVALLGRRLTWGPLALRMTFGLAALTLSFVLVSLEVRQAFHGTWLDQRGAGNAEIYSYSAAWIVFASVLLVWGIVSKGAVQRWASLAIMLIAVAKVFLYDTRELQDLYRVFSFLGLGATLMVLGFLYQRFVFRKEPAAGEADVGGGEAGESS